MYKFCARSLGVLLVMGSLCGCNAYQPTKNIWKTTKGIWNTYVSAPASVDYDVKSSLSPQAKALAVGMVGIDKELGRLERMMQNADRPPTREWLNNFLQTFPWVDGFAGVKYDGTILGQEPPNSLKELDFNGLLYEDKKQNSRALRADVQPGPLGPEIMLAAPLYDGVDFLGIVVAYFDMRSLMKFAQNPEDMVILCPTALLWPGKFEFTATPLAGTDWSKVVTESSSGTCTNGNGTFFYMVRYLGNLPLIFAVPEKGNFPEGDGNLEQGYAVFPAEREKLPPPPIQERKPEENIKYGRFGASEEAEEEENNEIETGKEEIQTPEPSQVEVTPQRVRTDNKRRSSNEIEPGNRDSLLLKGGKSTGKKRVQERSLEGENIILLPETPQKASPKTPEPSLNLIPEEESPTLPGGRPSPFGPREDVKKPTPLETPEKVDESREKTPTRDTTAPEKGAAVDLTNTEDNDLGERLADGEPANNEADEIKEVEPQNNKKVERSESAQEESPSGKADEGKKSQNETAPKTEDNEAASDTRLSPPLLPGGRPSPFGPKN